MRLQDFMLHCRPQTDESVIADRGEIILNRPEEMAEE